MSDTTSSSHGEEPDIPPGMPRVLTRNVIPSLTQFLDASDVLECYTLVRSAPLHGIANSTIQIQKTAIGFRYRPSGAAAIAAQYLEKRPIEMTLEYGPQRFGPLLHHEAMPYIQESEQESSFIGWENTGKIFYTTKIVTEDYLSSYYMASMTGAVLNKILVQAVEYSERRRRYQPFAVFSAEHGREVRSSSSVDFAQYIWKHLANLGVEIKPILSPPIYEARLWVHSWEKVVPQPYVANEAASFYSKLYQCLGAIATSDYSAYKPTPHPTVSPQPTALPTISSVPTIGEGPETQQPGSDNATSILPTEDDNFEEDGQDIDATISSAVPSTTLAPTSSPTYEELYDDDLYDDDLNENETNDNSGRRWFRERRMENFNDINVDMDDSLEVDDDYTDDLVEGDRFGDDHSNREDDDTFVDDDDNAGDTLQPTMSSQVPASPDPTLPPATSSPTTAAPVAPPSDQDGVEKAKQAAANAQQAADAAKNAAHTEGENKAADAAQAAANAAQAAADATSDAAAQSAMGALLSGDGSSMTSVINQCLTSEPYDIASVDENGTVTIHAFLYRDGSNYYKLNLTKPYLEIAKVNRALPKAVDLSGLGSGGGPVDFALALLLLSLLFMTGVIILQQMGYEFFTPLFRCQRWFFNPRKYDYEGNTLDQSENLFNYGQDGIPLSMGGRLTRISPVVARTPQETEMPDDPQLRMPELSQSLGSNREDSRGRSPVRREMEMSTLPSSRMRNVPSDNDTQGSVSDEELEVDSAVVPNRLYRDPDLVDMPYLKSSSKVAVPVGSGSHHGRNGGSGHANHSTVEAGHDDTEYSSSYS